MKKREGFGMRKRAVGPMSGILHQHPDHSALTLMITLDRSKIIHVSYLRLYLVRA